MNFLINMLLIIVMNRNMKKYLIIYLLTMFLVSCVDPSRTSTYSCSIKNNTNQSISITVYFSGDIIENAGVNTSLVFGAIDPAFAGKLGGTGDQMWAAGISLIIHPRNPRVPTVHANFRMIHAGEKFWFGGGADLTPFYPHEEDFYYRSSFFICL